MSDNDIQPAPPPVDEGYKAADLLDSGLDAAKLAAKNKNVSDLVGKGLDALKLTKNVKGAGTIGKVIGLAGDTADIVTTGIDAFNSGAGAGEVTTKVAEKAAYVSTSLLGNIVTGGLAGEATDKLLGRVDGAVQEAYALGSTSLELLGGREMTIGDAQQLVVGGVQMVAKNAEALADAAVASKPGQVVVTAMELSETYADTKKMNMLDGDKKLAFIKIQIEKGSGDIAKAMESADPKRTKDGKIDMSSSENLEKLAKILEQKEKQLKKEADKLEPTLPTWLQFGDGKAQAAFLEKVGESQRMGAAKDAMPAVIQLAKAHEGENAKKAAIAAVGMLDKMAAKAVGGHTGPTVVAAAQPQSKSSGREA